MDERTRLGIQVYCIAEQYNIPQTVVHSIISSFNDYCKDCLVRGEVVNYFGLVSVIPNVVTTDFDTTLAYRCYKVAKTLAMPEYTVFSIIRAYIQDAIDSVLSGKTAEIRGIVSVKPVYENGKITKIHSSISQSLKRVLVERNSVVDSVRVHTDKTLKDMLSK